MSAAETREAAARLLQEHLNGWAKKPAHDVRSGAMAALRDAILAIRAMPLPAETWTPTHLHIKSGNEYRVIAIGLIEATLHLCVVYDDKKGNAWIRPKPEFDDGRFMPLSLEEPTP